MIIHEIWKSEASFPDQFAWLINWNPKYESEARERIGGYRTVSRDRGGTWRGESGRGGPYRRRGIGFGWGLFWWMQRVQGFVTPNCHRSSTPDAPVAPARLEFSIVASSHSGIFLIAYYLLLLLLLLLMVLLLMLMMIPFRTHTNREKERCWEWWFVLMRSGHCDFTVPS